MLEFFSYFISQNLHIEDSNLNLILYKNCLVTYNRIYDIADHILRPVNFVFLAIAKTFVSFISVSQNIGINEFLILFFSANY